MIPGIDVSHWQGEIDWPKVKEAGVEFAYIKLTEGTATIDAMFERNWKAAKEAGILRGAYHFVTDSDIERQIDLFLKNLPSDTDLPPCFDFEYNFKTAASREVLSACLRAVPWMLIYSDPDWIEANITGPPLTPWPPSYPLWIAHYNVVKPSIAPWSTWTFWQHSNCGQVAGISGDVDLDWFNGTIEDLKKLPVSGV